MLSCPRTWPWWRSEHRDTFSYIMLNRKHLKLLRPTHRCYNRPHQYSRTPAQDKYSFNLDTWESEHARANIMKHLCVASHSHQAMREESNSVFAFLSVLSNTIPHMAVCLTLAWFSGGSLSAPGSVVWRV